MDANQIAESFGLAKGTLFASFFGALLSLRWMDKTVSWGAKFVMLAGGFVFSTYCAPPLTELLGMKGNFTAGLAFILGLFGMSLADAVYSMFKDGSIVSAIKGRIS